MKKAVVTVTLGESYQGFGMYSHPSFRLYAKKVGADFIILDKEELTVGFKKYDFHYPKYEEFKIKEIFNNYERVFYVDTDAFIKPGCPDVFDIVPFDKIGGVYDNKENENADQYRVNIIKQTFGQIDWQVGYINCGVYVLSNIHKEIFEILEIALIKKVWDQDVLNFNINKLGFKIHRLDIKFNGMSLYGYPTDKICDFDAFIPHYAAQGYRYEKLKFLYERYREEITRGLA